MSDTFPVRLRSLREKADLSISELAEKAGLARTAIHKLENGERSPSFETACKLADALKVNISKLRS